MILAKAKIGTGRLRVIKYTGLTNQGETYKVRRKRIQANSIPLTSDSVLSRVNSGEFTQMFVCLKRYDKTFVQRSQKSRSSRTAESFIFTSSISGPRTTSIPPRDKKCKIVTFDISCSTKSDSMIWRRSATFINPTLASA